MSEPVKVFRWNEFRLMRPLPTDTKEFAAMLLARKLGFNFEDDPALYVRKMLDRLLNPEVEYIVGDIGSDDGPHGEPYRLDWHGFVGAVRKYLGDKEADAATAMLVRLAGGGAQIN